jgi:hypothetical protein
MASRALPLLIACAARMWSASADAPADPAPAAPVHLAVDACAQVVVAPPALRLPPHRDDGDDGGVTVDARVVAPDGAARIQPCFWYEPQQAWTERAYSTVQKAMVGWERFRARGAPGWCLRFAPEAPGRWSWEFQVAHGGTRWTVPGGELTADPARAGAGAVHCIDGGFASDDGRPFIPVGLNLAWPNEDGAGGYARWLDALARAGGNATRLWLVHYFGGTAPEWSSSLEDAGYRGVGRYSQEAGARVDAILEAAAARDVRIMLCVWTFGDCSFDWKDNPYAKTGGGWLEDPGAFFTDATALEAQERLLRYAVARWGAYRSLWCWELWNEVDSCASFDDAAVAAWHHRMAPRLRALDAHHHPITTSYRFGPPNCPCAAYQQDGIDFAQVHSYELPVVEAVCEESSGVAALGKPWLAGEVGLNVTPDALGADPLGLHMHDALWSGVFAGGMGGGMAWWWDTYVAPRDLWPHLSGLARFCAGESLSGLHPVAVRPDRAQAWAAALAGGDRLWAWVATPRHIEADHAHGLMRYGMDAEPAADRLTFDLQRPGWWLVTYVDPYDGAWMGEAAVEERGSRHVHLPLIPYRDEIALKARHCDARPIPAAGPPTPTPWHDRLERAP